MVPLVHSIPLFGGLSRMAVVLRSAAWHGPVTTSPREIQVWAGLVRRTVPRVTSVAGLEAGIDLATNEGPKEAQGKKCNCVFYQSSVSF